MKDELTLKNIKLRKKDLFNIGFIEYEETFKYEEKIMNNKFLLTINIDKDNVITSKVIELSTNEEFILYNITNAKGDFVGEMRSSYTSIIDRLKKCGTKDIFKTEQMNLIIKYIKDKYNDEPEFLWESTSDNAAIRNKKNNKWYCALLIPEKTKLGIKEPGRIEVINLMQEPDRVLELVDYENYFPGYHMNKKYWISIRLDSKIDIDEIYKLIDKSYELSINKNR